MESTYNYHPVSPSFHQLPAHSEPDNDDLGFFLWQK